MKKNIFKRIRNLTLFLLGTILVTLTFNIFCVPNNYVTGGVSGISIIFKYLFDIEISKTLMIGNIAIIIIGVIVLGIKDIVPSLFGTFVYTLNISLTENINNYLNIHISDTFLNIVIVGLLFGVGYTLVYLAGYTTGGSDILGLIFKKKFNLPLGKSLFMINAIILAIATFTLGFEMLVIALVEKFIESHVIDSFLLGISDSKVLFIRTNKISKINEYIINEINSGTSILDITSGYKGKKGKMIMCVVPTEKYIKLKEEIKKIDESAFITILDSYEVYGGTNKYKLPLHDLRV